MLDSRPEIYVSVTQHGFGLGRNMNLRKNMRLRLRALWAIFLVSSSVCFASSREKTDIVYMRNGDKITGEIQSLEKGQLNIKPEYTNSSFVIDWTKVDHLESNQLFVVTDPNGVLYAGTLARGVDEHTIAVVSAQHTTLPNESVIEIDELGSTFLKRMRGNIDLGLSLTQSNEQKNFTLQTGLSYQSEKNYYSLSSSTQFTSQKETSDTNETTVKTAYFHELSRSNWYGGAIANFLSSSEQQIALQSTLGGAMARRLIFTNRTNLTAVAGLGYTIQRNDDGTTSTTRTHALDSAFAVQYSTFRFDSTTFDTTLWLYPSLTSPGHMRLTLNQDVYYKFLGDFYIRVSFYDNYDNQPVVGAPTNNLGGSTSIGWSFH